MQRNLGNSTVMEEREAPQWKEMSLRRDMLEGMEALTSCARKWTHLLSQWFSNTGAFIKSPQVAENGKCLGYQLYP